MSAGTRSMNMPTIRQKQVDKQKHQYRPERHAGEEVHQHCREFLHGDDPGDDRGGGDDEQRDRRIDRGLDQDAEQLLECVFVVDEAAQEQGIDDADDAGLGGGGETGHDGAEQEHGQQERQDRLLEGPPQLRTPSTSARAAANPSSST